MEKNYEKNALSFHTKGNDYKLLDNINEESLSQIVDDSDKVTLLKKELGAVIYFFSRNIEYLENMHPELICKNSNIFYMLTEKIDELSIHYEKHEQKYKKIPFLFEFIKNIKITVILFKHYNKFFKKFRSIQDELFIDEIYKKDTIKVFLELLSAENIFKDDGGYYKRGMRAKLLSYEVKSLTEQSKFEINTYINKYRKDILNSKSENELVKATYNIRQAYITWLSRKFPQK